MIKIVVSGSKGRMGTMILNLARKDPQLNVTGAFDKDDDPQTAVRSSDVLIEFTTPEATIKNLKVALQHNKAMVIGTTGLSDGEQKIICDAAKRIPIVFSPNMAIGVNLLFGLVSQASCVLDKSYKPSISETHHVHKKDAPSGTAKRLRELIAQAMNISVKDIDISSKREGEVVGDHTVIFESTQERLELKHSAKTREVFAKGALEAAKFVAGKKALLYNMFDVLGLK